MNNSYDKKESLGELKNSQTAKEYTSSNSEMLTPSEIEQMKRKVKEGSERAREYRKQQGWI